MKIDFYFQYQGIRSIKSIFTRLIKIFFNYKHKMDIYFIYFFASAQIRFLINTDDCMAVIGIDSNLVTNNISTKKQNSQLIAVQFINGKQMIESFCNILQKDIPADIHFNLSRQTNQHGQILRFFNISCQGSIQRTKIHKPSIDPLVILNHQWINGCSENDTKVSFQLEVEHLLNVLKLFVRNKEMCVKQKCIFLCLKFKQLQLVALNQKQNFRSSSKISELHYKNQECKGQYVFRISTQDINQVYQLFQVKSSNNKFRIDKHNRLVFTYLIQGVYQCQFLSGNWIQCQSFKQYYKPSTIKIQYK